MKAIRVVLRALVLSAVFACLIFSAQAIGSTQPPPEALMELHLTECQLPCWLGIIPGKTTFDAAVRQVTAVYAGTITIQTTDTTDFYYLDTLFGKIAFGADKGGGIRQVSLLTYSDAIAFGDIVNLLGLPTCQVQYQLTEMFYSSGTNFVVFAGEVDQGWRTKLWTIDIVSNQADPCLHP